MKTIKLPIQNQIDIQDIQRIYSSAVRYAYNRHLESRTEKEIRCLMKNKFDLGSWLVQCSIKHSLAILDSQRKLKIPKIVFGSKKNFIKRSQHKISKEEYQESRLFPIQCQGEKSQKGNRHFDLDIENNQIIFKQSRNNKQKIKLPKLRKNIKKELLTLERLSKNKELAFQINLTKSHIYIVFDEKPIYKELHVERIDNRVLGIDLNPNYIGYSILEFDEKDHFKVIHKEVIDIKELNKQKSSKKDFEFYQISRRIVTIANHFNVSKIVLEELNFSQGDKGKGRRFNKLVNNDWNRNILLTSLKKHSNINNIKYLEVNAAYSSTVGNLLYGDENTPDMVASSIEVARRGYKKFRKGWFYLSLESLKNTGNQWKEDLYLRFNSWIEIHREIKNTKMKYRILLEDCCPDAVFRLSSIKSHVNLYSFI
jgi:IS605 OrfB family transposase